MSQTPNFRAFGQSHESWATLEGVLSTPPNDGGAGNYWDYASFEEAAGGGDAPEEMIAFNFGKIAVEYTPQSPAGAPGAVIKAGWDLTKNLKI